MKKTARHNQVVEHLTRPGETSLHEIGDNSDTQAHTYHYHTTVEVIVVQRGEAEGLIGEVRGVLRRGTVVVLGNDVPHGVLRATPDCRCLLVHLPAELLHWDAERFPELGHGMEFLRACRSGVVYEDAALARQVNRTARQIEAAEGFERLALLLHLLHLLCTTPYTQTLKAKVPGQEAARGMESAVDRAYRYLYAHFREPITLADVAAHAGMQPTALCRAFKKADGGTVNGCITRLRLEHACHLLLTTGWDVQRIAYAAGYNSYSHFCTQFRRFIGTSPTAYRQQTEGSKQDADM